MTFSDELNRFGEGCFFKTKEAFVETAQLCHQSIQTGSPITGAPGQPVDTGALRASWILSFTSEAEATISTNLPYALPIEEGIGKHGPLHLRSSVGGWHSVALTRIGFQKIVDYVARRVKGA